MHFLVDAQLPPALARWLEDNGQMAEHVFDRGMAAASDREIWEYAEATGAIIVTKDEDFAQRRSITSGGPSVLWIRRGNTTRRQLLVWFAPLLPAVIDAFQQGEVLVEIV
jgi:predicted nuclease of predicted toxin-antitoxin system